MNNSNQKKTLLVLASTYPRWQGDHEPGFVHELSKRLTNTFDVIVVCPHAIGSKKYEQLDGVNVYRYRYAPLALETLVNNGGIVTNLKVSPWKILLLPLFFLSQLLMVLRLLKHNKVDVVHAHWLIPQGLTLALLGLFSKIPPFLVTSHGADLFALRGKLFNSLKRFVAAISTHLSVVSEVMKETLCELGVKSEKISVLPMGVNMELFKQAGEVVRSKYELLFVGRLVEKKGLCYLIAAMPEILKSHPDAYLTVIGFGPEEDKLKNQVCDLNLQHKVDFIGAVKQKELVKYYQRAAIFVAPFIKAKSGDQEGLGLVLVEAVACGCSVIVSDIPACKDVINDVPNVFLFPVGDINLLSNAVSNVLFHNKKELIKTENANSLLSTRFGWENVVERYSILLNKMVSRG